MCIHHGTSLLKHSCWLSTTSHICLRIDFSLLQSNPHQSFPRHLPEPIRSNTPSLLSHTDLSAPRLFHTTSCLFFTFTHNISSLQSIRLSRSSSNVPSSVEPSPTFSGPVDRSCSVLPQCVVHTSMREQDLFPCVIPAVTWEWGIRHVPQRTANACSMMCTLQIHNQFKYSVQTQIMCDLEQVYSFSLLRFSLLWTRNNPTM